eukprot:s652_g15.t1
MSVNSDPDLVELSLELAGLAITVRGPASQAADFVRQLAPSSSNHSAVSEGSGYPRAEEERGRPRSVRSSASSETRSSILASFPKLPDRLLGLAEANLSSAKLSAKLRAERAWVAGQWARAVIGGRVSSPNRSETIELGNRFWCVVKCASCEVPQVFTTSAAYFRAIGSLSGSDTVSHAFPSETEARIYVEAAGFEFPSFS